MSMAIIFSATVLFNIQHLSGERTGRKEGEKERLFY